MNQVCESVLEAKRTLEDRIDVLAVEADECMGTAIDGQRVMDGYAQVARAFDEHVAPLLRGIEEASL